jgi:DNA repair protein RecN (Recombination protein N)
LLDGARAALAALSDEEPGADTLTARAIQALDEVQRFDAELGNVAEQCCARR